jgi:hypothetical protein
MFDATIFSAGFVAAIKRIWPFGAKQPDIRAARNQWLAVEIELEEFLAAWRARHASQEAETPRRVHIYDGSRRRQPRRRSAFMD